MSPGAPLAALAFILASLPGPSPPPGAAERPKIGLALSGGGARGCAHVGVLKALEELRVPVDYVAGTSMGAVVGGLYAAGLTPDELARLVLELDWDDTLKDRPSRQSLSFRRKEEDRRYLFDLELGFRDRRFLLPGGLRSGQKLSFLLHQLSLPVADVEDFDRLPTPFRAVATDITSGEMVVLERGSLAAAIRASMAIPGVFSPVELDGRLLVDGGVVNNLPVDLVREMGADVVLAVDIGDPLASREELDSFLQITGQTVSFLVRREMLDQLRRADLVLRPQVEGYATLEFTRGGELIQRGLEETRKRAGELAAYALSADDYRDHRASRAPPASRLPVIDFVRFEGNDRVASRLIEQQIRFRPGQTLDLDAVGEDLGRIYGLGHFAEVEMSVVEEAGQTGLALRGEEKPWGPHYLHFGLEISANFEDQADFGLLANLTSMPLNPLGGELQADLSFGRRRALEVEIYQPLDAGGRHFAAAAIGHQQRLINIFEQGRKISELEVRTFGARLSLGRQFGRFGEARVSLFRGVGKVGVITGSDPAPIDRVEVGGLGTSFVIDTLDSASIPRDGTVLATEAVFSRPQFGAEDRYDKVQASFAAFRSRGRHTAFLGLQAGWSPGGELPVYDQFTLGGFLSFSGLVQDELRGQSIGVLRTGYYCRIGHLPATFGEGLYAGGWLEAGNVWQQSSRAGLHTLLFAATAAVGADTALGPLYLAYGRTDRGDDSLYFTLGVRF